MTSSHCSAKPADDPTEQLDATEVSEYPAQDEEGDENRPEGFDQATVQKQTDDADSGAPAVDRFDEDESSNEAEPGEAQPAGDEEHTTGLFSDEHTEQPVGVVEGDREEGSTDVTVSDSGYPGSTEDLDATAVHEHPDVHNTPPLGGDSTGHEEVVATNEDSEADYNENGPNSERGETVTIEGDARDGDWEPAASDAQQAQDDLGQHEAQHNAAAIDKGEQVPCSTSTDDLTPLLTGFDTVDLTTSGLDDGPQQSKWLPSAATCIPFNLTVDTDTDSIGQQTSDELADAQEKSRYDHSYEGEGSNSNTGECSFSDSFQLTLTQSLDQANELIPDLDQFGDDFNWDEDFGGDFDDGEFGESEEQSNVETKTVDPQEPISGRSSKRGFDEIDSDTADEEQTPGDVSPSELLSTPLCSSRLMWIPQTQNGRRWCSPNLRWMDTVRAHVWPLHLFPPFHSHLFPPTTNPRSSISPCSRHKHLLSSQTLHRGSAPGMNSLLILTGFHLLDEGLSFWAPARSSKATDT